MQRLRPVRHGLLQRTIGLVEGKARLMQEDYCERSRRRRLSTGAITFVEE